MAETSYPHTSTPVGEPGWRQMGRLYTRSGVVGTVAGELAVSADGADLTVDVAAGRAYVDGFVYDLDAVTAVTIATADATDDRIDLVVLRYDPDGTGTDDGTVRLAVVAGTPAATPAAPSPTQDADGIFEFPLAEVLVTAAGSTISAGDVTDVRRFTTGPFDLLSGYVETLEDLGDVSGTVTLDWATANVWRINPTAAVDLAFANLPAAGLVAPGTLIVGNSTYAVTWPAGTKHPGGDPPTLDGETWLSMVARSTHVTAGAAWVGVA